MRKLTRVRTPYSVNFLSTGSSLLDCCLGGGWALGRIANLVGDKSTGKTLLATEACASALRTNAFKRIGKDSVRVVYDVAEGAIDYDVGKMYGISRGEIIWRYSDTVEDFDKAISEEIAGLDETTGLVYVLDSLDSLTTEAEKAFDFAKHKRMAEREAEEKLSGGKGKEKKKEKGTYGTEKAKLMNRFFRRNVLPISQKEILLLIISQVRQKIGVSFGKKKKRSCADALDFYEAQELWLSETQKIPKKVLKKDVVVGLRVRAINEKSKVGMPYRTVDMSLLFDYGLDNIGTNVDFLYNLVDGWGRAKKGVGKSLDWYGKQYTREGLISHIEDTGQEVRLARKVIAEWREIDDATKPDRKRKYS